MTELYKTWRPLGFKEVYGQDDAVKLLKSFLPDRVPQAIVFTGPSGCGKTTLARIVVDKLAVHGAGFQEINAAEARGIDEIRRINSEMGMGHLGGRRRAYLIDEAHKLTSDAQSGLLKMLEDTPKEVYFMLATTDPTKLLLTIRTRCTEVKLVPVKPEAMKASIAYVLESAKLTASEKVVAKIVESAGGSLRQAMVYLNSVVGMASEEEQLNAVVRGTSERQAFDLVKMLLWESATWPKVAELLKALKEQEAEIEPLRQALLSCAFGEMLKGDKKAGWANLIVEEFGKPFFDSKWAGVGSACWNVMQIRMKR